MFVRHNRIHSAAGLAAAVGLTLGLAACDVIGPSREIRETARIQVSGTSPVPLILMTSDQFVNVQDGATGQILTQIIEADSLIIDQLPIDTTYSLGQFNRFLVRLINPDSTQTAEVRMIVRLDDEDEVYNVHARVTGAFLEYSYYVF
jgi:hypothetical protein